MKDGDFSKIESVARHDFMNDNEMEDEVSLSGSVSSQDGQLEEQELKVEEFKQNKNS